MLPKSNSSSLVSPLHSVSDSSSVSGHCSAAAACSGPDLFLLLPLVCPRDAGWSSPVVGRSRFSTVVLIPMIEPTSYHCAHQIGSLPGSLS